MILLYWKKIFIMIVDGGVFINEIETGDTIYKK